MQKYLFIAFSIFYSLYCAFPNAVENKDKVVILNFKSINSNQGLADAVTENFITSLVDTNSYVVVERTQLDAIIAEMKLGNSDDFDDSQIIEVGRFAKAKIALVGSLTKLGNVLTINVRGIDIETGNVIFGKKSQANNENELAYAIDELVSSFVGIDKTSTAKKAENPEHGTESAVQKAASQDAADVFKKYTENRNSGISLLSSGLVLALFAAPAAGLFVYANNREAALSNVAPADYNDEENNITLLRVLAVSCTIVSVIGGICLIVAIGKFIAAAILYNSWQSLQKQVSYIAPVIESDGQYQRFGLSLSLCL